MMEVGSWVWISGVFFRYRNDESGLLYPEFSAIMKVAIMAIFGVMELVANCKTAMVIWRQTITRR